MTLSGKQFQSSAAATGKARLPTVDSLIGGTTRRPSQQNEESVDPADQRRGQVVQGKLALLHAELCASKQAACTISLWVPQPVKTDECVSDVVAGPQSVDKMGSCVQHRL